MRLHFLGSGESEQAQNIWKEFVMANTHGAYLSGVDLDRPVLATLTDASMDET